MLRPDAERIVRTLRPGDAQAVVDRGLDLIRGGCAEVLFPLARNAARRFPDNPRVQQLLGLAARESQRTRIALEAFTAAARLAPGDALIAHSLARVTLEAGKPSVAVFDRARALAPNDGMVLLGRAAAQLQQGLGEEAVDDLSAIVAANPLWLDGHRSLAHLRGQFGLAPDAAIRAAIVAQPRSADLHRLLITTLLEARDLDGASRAIVSARGALGEDGWLALLAAHVASESGNRTEADDLFARSPPAHDTNTVSLQVRHLVRAERADAAIRLLDGWAGGDPENVLWPYRSLAWRMASDPRHKWLEGDPRLVGVYDLADQVGDLEALGHHLRALHFASAPPLDQSVRGGTQTDGNLLLRDDPAIAALRKAIMRAVERHVAQLAEHEPGHPTLLAHRDPLRIAGSWSVRLFRQGHHSDHVHSQGWLSSAFYVALPDSLAREGSGDAAGWLSLGEARDLVPALPPLALIEPRPGRLVLFPSVMWHGTRPFPEGERLTVALDIARPQQS
jgi:tetratricopeptide (TPR) repeat protein